MPPSSSGEDRVSRAFAAYWVLFLALQIAIARLATIDFYDAFVYLCNSRRLAGAFVSFSDKPVLLPLLHLPLQRLLGACAAGLEARIWAPHLLQIAVSTACLAACYAYFRRCLQPRWARLAVVLLSLNRMVVHFFWAVLPDIPSALFLVLALLWTEDGQEPAPRWRAPAAAAAVAACLLSRTNMIALPPLVAGAMLLQRRSGRTVARFCAIAAAGTALFLIVYALVLMRVFSLGPVAGFQRLVYAVRFYYGTTSAAPAVSRRGYLDALLVSGGWPAFAFAAAGLGLALGGRDRKAGLAALVTAGYLAVMTFGLRYQESRYVLPIVPLFYLLAALALQRLAQARLSLLPVWAPAALVGAFALAAGAREWSTFLSPVYRDPAVLEAGRAVSAEAPPASPVFWDGASDPLVPPAATFTREDPLFYSYYVPSRESAEYLLGRPIREMARRPRPGDIVIRAMKAAPGGRGAIAILRPRT